MSGECILQMKNISLSFPGVLALDNAQFEAYRGETHILVGENGAGKSTIMKLLAGINTDYSGKVIFKGEEIQCSHIQEQRKRGISMIFQEMNLLGNLTVAENIYMGRQPLTAAGGINWSKMQRDTRKLLDTIGSDISETTVLHRLSIGQMQMVEIAKALSFQSDIIIMDEPTSALTEKEVSKLFEMIRRLKEQNVAIVYISHRMEELMQIGDRITVLRDGKYIKTLMKDETTIQEVINLMVGRELNEYYPRVDVEPGTTAIEVKNIKQGRKLKDVSFYARKGEITGFYGLMGAGRTELMRAVFGADSYDSGKIIIGGSEKKINTCEKAKKCGIALLTEDRKNQGLVLEFDVSDNISLPNIPKIMGKFGISKSKEKKINKKLVEEIKIKTPSLSQKVKNLSGGNQQKVVLAKWLNTDVDIIIFDEPTRGIDVGSKVEIYKIMNTLKQEGKAIIIVSSELTECLGISDRLYIMHEGEIKACIEGQDIRLAAEKDIIHYATGQTEITNGELS